MNDENGSPGRTARMVATLSDRENVGRLLGALGVSALALILADFVVKRKDYTSLGETSAIYALMGFGAVVMVILVAAILRKLLSRPAEFYGAYGTDMDDAAGMHGSERGDG